MTFNKKILHALILMSALFLSLVGYLTYFQIFRGPELANTGSNPRTFIEEDKIQRGDIYDRNGKKLAYSETDSEGQKRIYPYGSLYSHVIGYSNHTYGRSNIENQFNGQLMGTDFVNSIFGLKDYLSGDTKEGADLTLTIDHNLQKTASDRLGNRKGAVVAIDPQTGEVLALVSKPTFDPSVENLKENWEDIINDGDSPLLARATSGLYPPGSSFKTIIAAAGIDDGLDGVTYEDTGSIIVGGMEFFNYGQKVYGEMDINRAFALSCNTYFIDMADKLGEGKIRDAAEKFMFNTEVEFDIPLATSSVLTGDNSKTEIAATGMGQGDTLATPFQMALVACAAANDGTIMRPYIVQSAKASNGAVTYRTGQKILGRAMDAVTASQISSMMSDCVEYGTGVGTAVSGVSIYGKTGTAENAEGKDHAWFICYGEYNNKKIAVCVMVEYAGVTGSEACIPVANEIIRQWKNNI